MKNENDSIYFSREQNENEIEENIENYPQKFNTYEIMNIKEIEQEKKSVNNIRKLDKNFEKIQ